MTYPRAVLTTWLLALLLALLLAYEVAHAGELYLDAAGGFTRFILTATDGDYIQRGLPSKLDLNSMAYKVGLGYRFNERWSVQGGYINLGTINQTAKFVSDEDYAAKQSLCVKNCATAPTYRITDAYHGGELTLTRTFKLDESWSWHLKAGGAYLMHRFTINKEDGSGQSNQHYGQFPATVVGAGIGYKWFRTELTWYHGIGGANGPNNSSGWPLSTQLAVAWMGFNIPLWGG